MARQRVRVHTMLALQLALAAVTGCARGDGPRPLVQGEDACAFCRMAISDVRYGGEVRTSTGRLLTFDAVECLVGYLDGAGDRVRHTDVWVADYQSGTMVAAESALFVLGGTLHSPMGRQLTSFAPTITPTELIARYNGKVLTWPQVTALELTPPHGADSVGSPASHGH